MRNLLRILFIPLLIIFIFTSCENDDSSTPAPNNDPVIDGDGNINLEALRIVNPQFKMENLRELGSSSRSLARDAVFKSVTLEIVSVNGFEPSEFAVETLVQFISDRLNKPEGVNLVQRSIPSPGIEAYTVQSVFGMVEAPNRTQFNTNDDLAIFIYFADQDDEQTEFSDTDSSVILGTAYLNTSFVIYESTLRRLTRNNTTDLARIEAGTLNHEFCHLLGLVNSEFTPQQEPHEDQIQDDEGNLVGNNHCDVRFCLMEATATFTTDMMNNLNVLELDPLCIQDLRAIGGK